MHLQAIRNMMFQKMQAKTAVIQNLPEIQARHEWFPARATVSASLSIRLTINPRIHGRSRFVIERPTSSLKRH